MLRSKKFRLEALESRTVLAADIATAMMMDTTLDANADVASQQVDVATDATASADLMSTTAAADANVDGSVEASLDPNLNVPLTSVTDAVNDIERVRSLIDDLESKQSIAEVLDSAREADAARIFIGSENRLFALSGSSVIASPYRDREGRVIGVLGVIGPTRLNYARVVPMVDFTARSLGKLIG